MRQEYVIVNLNLQQPGVHSDPPPSLSPLKKQTKKGPNFHIYKENKIKDKVVIPLLKLSR